MAKTTRPAESSKKQPRGKPFQPGQSGNPGGRKPKTDEERTLEQMCRAKSGDALAVLMQIMESGEQERNRMTAALAIIERGHGKAVQPTTVGNPDGTPIDHSLHVHFVKP